MGLWKETAADLRLYASGRATFGAFLRCFVFSPGFLALFHYRLCRWSARLWLCRKVPGFRLLPGLFIRIGQFATGCEINPQARIEPGVKIHHPSGLVIGVCVIKSGAQLFQGVTLGADGVTARDQDRYPTVENDATIFAGAKVIGAVRVGRRAIVGANAVLNTSIPDGAVAVGVPARVVKVNPVEAAPESDT